MPEISDFVSDFPWPLLIIFRRILRTIMTMMIVIIIPPATAK